MKRLVVLLGFAAAVAASRPAQAQLGARSWEFEPFAGVVNFDSDLNLKDRVGFGGRLGYNLTNNWALEGTFNFTPNADFDTAAFPDLNGLDLPQTSVILAHGNLLYNFALNNSRLVPFVTAGGGVANFNPNNNDNIASDTETDGEVNAGGGLKLFLTRTVAIRGDVRHHWIFAREPNQEPLTQPNDNADHKSTSNWEYTGGLAFNF